jgi:hypothetical protein
MYVYTKEKLEFKATRNEMQILMETERSTEVLN